MDGDVELRARRAQLELMEDFQIKELVALQDELGTLNHEIEGLEGAIATESDIVSAMRGVVGARGGEVLRPKRLLRTATWAKQRQWTRRDGSIIRQTREISEGSAVVAQLTTGVGDRSALKHALQSCGMLYTPFHKRFEAPRQSLMAHASAATIVLTGRSTTFLRAVCVGQLVWLLYWLDRNDGLWRSFVRPPRAKNIHRIGLFATRSPNRPSPLGLSLCVVDRVDVSDNIMQVSGLDVLDETPLIGLRLYDEKSDSFPNARAGWLDNHNAVQPLYYDDISDDECHSVVVHINSIAAQKLDFIQHSSAVDIKKMIRLSLHKVLRERMSLGENIEEADASIQKEILPVGAFRVFYEIHVAMKKFFVIDVASGMRLKVCEEEADTDPEALLHLSFQKKYRTD